MLGEGVRITGPYDTRYERNRGWKRVPCIGSSRDKGSTHLSACTTYSIFTQVDLYPSAPLYLSLLSLQLNPKVLEEEEYSLFCFVVSAFSVLQMHVQCQLMMTVEHKIKIFQQAVFSLLIETFYEPGLGMVPKTCLEQELYEVQKGFPSLTLEIMLL